MWEVGIFTLLYLKRAWANEMSGSQPQPKNLCVRCLLCNEKISYNREQTELLINHVKVFHPYIEVARLKPTDSPDNLHANTCLNEPTTDKAKSAVELSKHESSDPQKIKCQGARKTRRSDNWKPGKGKIICKKCGSKGEPIIDRRKSTDMKTGGTLRKTCFQLWCSPFSYLSLINSNELLDLHCRKCKGYIGTYDYRTETMHDPSSAPAGQLPKYPNKISFSNSAPNITLKAVQCKQIKEEGS